MHGCEQNIPYCRVSFSFLPKRGQNERLYGLLGGGGGGGGQANICVQSMMQTRGWWNLGLFSHKHNLPFMCHSSLYIIE